MGVQAVWAEKVTPDNPAGDLHEFFGAYYRLTPERPWTDAAIKAEAEPAVWVRFERVEQLERLQAGYPEARLGPVSSYTEALLITETWDEAQKLRDRVAALFEAEEAGEMDELLKEDTMEDY